MAEYKSFKAVANKIERAIQGANIQALNRAASSGNAQAKKLLREDTGIDAKVIKSRLRVLRANRENDRATVSYGTKAKFYMDDLRPLAKTVRTAAGKRQGVTIKIGKGARTLAPGVFLIAKSSGRSKANKDYIGIQRKGASRLPTTRTPFDIVPTIQGHIPSVKTKMLESFIKSQPYYLNEQMKKLK